MQNTLEKDAPARRFANTPKGPFQLPFTRREILQLGGAGVLLATVPAFALAGGKRHAEVAGADAYQGTDDELLDEIERAAFDFFWTEASPITGQVKDRALANGGDTRVVSSIAATGFGLTALCIGDRRKYRKPAETSERVRHTLRFLADKLPHQHVAHLQMQLRQDVGETPH